MSDTLASSVFFSSEKDSRPSLASHNSIYTESLFKCFAEEYTYTLCIFSLDSEQLILDGAWMDDSDKNSLEPA